MALQTNQDILFKVYHIWILKNTSWIIYSKRWQPCFYNHSAFRLCPLSSASKVPKNHEIDLFLSSLSETWQKQWKGATDPSE